MSRANESRRDFVKRAAYVAPAVLTLAAAPEFAKAGSSKAGGSAKDKDRGGADKGKARGQGRLRPEPEA